MLGWCALVHTNDTDARYICWAGVDWKTLRKPDLCVFLTYYLELLLQWWQKTTVQWRVAHGTCWTNGHRELTISFDKDWVARKAPDSHDGIEKNALSTLGLFSLICMNGLKWADDWVLGDVGQWCSLACKADWCCLTTTMDDDYFIPPHPFSNRTVFEDDAWTIYNGNAVAVLGLSGLIDTDAAWLEQPAEVDWQGCFVWTLCTSSFPTPFSHF